MPPLSFHLSPSLLPSGDGERASTRRRILQAVINWALAAPDPESKEDTCGWFSLVVDLFSYSDDEK
jgi:hypothetical protein